MLGPECYSARSALLGRDSIQLQQQISIIKGVSKDCKHSLEHLRFQTEALLEHLDFVIIVIIIQAKITLGAHTNWIKCLSD